MWVLVDVYGDKVVCNNTYENLEEAKADLDAEFHFFTYFDNDIEYGKDCCLANDIMSAWARLNGKYRVWNIVKVF